MGVSQSSFCPWIADSVHRSKKGNEKPILIDPNMEELMQKSTITSHLDKTKYDIAHW